MNFNTPLEHRLDVRIIFGQNVTDGRWLYRIYVDDFAPYIPTPASFSTRKAAARDCMEQLNYFNPSKDFISDLL